MKINFSELEKMNYENGKKLLLEAGYIQGYNDVDKKTGFNINDEYYTLYDDNGNVIHDVSFVSYTKDIPNDEPECVDQENWHWSEV